MAKNDMNKSAVSSMKDCYDYSPAQNPSYDYKKGTKVGINASEVTMNKMPMYSKSQTASMTKMAKYEQDKMDY